MARWKIPGLAGRPRFTSRATVLVLVLCSLVAILAYPTRQFMNQRAQISDQRVKAEQARQQVEQLKTEWARWQDPMFVKAQARERLHYALPGETPFVSIDPTPSATPPQPAGAGSPQAAAKAAKPWYAAVWDSVDAAAAPAPTPAPSGAPAP
ncbi:septum formation initiator family protein [Kitasatospora sp. NBC_01250]|uniref:FtsB family cell division protein n=1 Tax=unclassified Kitasatospora TaxID=2633591 RepID=UPI002E167563|nr:MULTISPECIES: septum formation initiator family protein [unclassified Kitasatospora]WSJ68881.1 septum formation initiator family protein [Kitasatospora sp. NBC_01302]